MKKIIQKLIILISLGIIIAVNLNAQTGKELLTNCATAMRWDKLDSFQTWSVKLFIYGAGQKVSLKIFSKNNDLKESFTRVEQTMTGNEEVFVLTDNDFFRLVPNYELLDMSDAATIYQLLTIFFPSAGIMPLLFDTTDAFVLKLVGTEKINNSSCKKVSFALSTEPQNILQYFYFDEVTNYMVSTEMPEQKVSFVFEGMKREKGYVYASTIKMLQDGKKVQEFEIDKLEFNIELDDSLFAKPRQ